MNYQVKEELKMQDCHFDYDIDDYNSEAAIIRALVCFKPIRKTILARLFDYQLSPIASEFCKFYRYLEAEPESQKLIEYIKNLTKANMDYLRSGYSVDWLVALTDFCKIHHTLKDQPYPC